ncbi:hypothetical protein FACS1894158_15880 [Betaproteobacteria bacterium]|nr:hypothetical protein FACS1894158_15880 [Betaproteobacteria bacterium]
MHENDRLLTITANWRCGQTKHKLRFDLFQDGIERYCANMMAFIDDNVTVVLNQRIDLALAGQ